MKLWRCYDGKNKTEYIYANSLDEAKEIFDARNSYPAVEFQVMDDIVHALYLSDESTNKNVP